MFFVDQLLLYGSLLVLLGILSRKFSARYGIPVLVLFLLLGMLAGSEGVGGIPFENYEIAHGIGTVALAIILFDGGLRTTSESMRLAWKPAIVLATLGVLITAAVTGLFAAWMLGIDPLQGLLLASIVASTDASAVFSILRSAGVRLKNRLAATLELESGSNDPMAIFLTVGLIEVLLGERSLGVGLLTLFGMQMGIGVLVGYLAGRGAALLVNRINLDTAGLYPVLVLSLGLVTYGLAASLGGSGFLAAYIAGIILGNSSLVFQRGTLLFHDGIAWVSQIVMFVVLGLLSFPSQLIAAAPAGLAVALVLIFVARPLATLLTVWGFRFSVRELVFISWVGLKGAVPIILATFPLLMGLPNGVLYFNVIFFVVIISSLTQGWSLPVAARKLGLQLPSSTTPPATLDITSIRHVNADIVDYRLADDSAATGFRISELRLPEDVVIAMVTRGSDIIPARGQTVLLPGDHVFVILRPGSLEGIDAAFGPTPVRPEAPLRAGVLVPGALTAGELLTLYGYELTDDADLPLREFMLRRLRKPLQAGDFVETGELRLYVHERSSEEELVLGIEEITA